MGRYLKILTLLLSVLNIHWKDWCWNSNTLATWCEELTHWKSPWCWEILKTWGEGDDRGWDGWMASPTHWTWVWANSRRQWRTGKPGVLQFMGSQRVRHNVATEEQQQGMCILFITVLVSVAIEICISLYLYLLLIDFMWVHLVASIDCPDTHVCCCCLIAKLCLTLCNPMDCSPPCSSVHGIF